MSRRLLMALVFLVGNPSAGFTQQEEIVPFEGTQAFANILHFFGLQPLQDIAELKNVKPAETVLVLFGETAPLDDIRQQIGSLRRFREAGGAILIASDRPAAGRLRELGIDISGAVVHQIADSAYRNKPHYPIVRSAQKHPIFEQIEKPLATNSPSFLSYDRLPILDFLASFPADCFLADSGGRLPFNSTFMMGTLGWNKQNRVLVLAGHSVFMNGLLGQEDNGNFAFANNCVRWLSEDPSGAPRQYVLFIDEGNLVQRLDAALTVPVPQLPEPVAALNQLLHDLEQENFFYRLLYGDGRWPGLVDPQQMLRGIILTSSLLLFIYIIYLILQNLHRSDLGAPLPQAYLQQRLNDPAPLMKRQQAQIRTNNYRETAQYLAREFFLRFTPELKAFDPVRPPRFPLHGAWWQRRRLTANLQYLWRMACGVPRSIGARELRKALRIMDEFAVPNKALLRHETTAQPERQA